MLPGLEFASKLKGFLKQTKLVIPIKININERGYLILFYFNEGIGRLPCSSLKKQKRKCLSEKGEISKK
jgi:hypothetical protein